MSEPKDEGSTPEMTLLKAGQALLLARIVASVVAFGWFLAGQLAVGRIGSFQAMFAELGADAELPMITNLIVRFQYGVVIGLPLLFLATLFFIWSNGRLAAWLAGAGLLMLTIFTPLVVWAMFQPVVKIITEMGNM